MSIIVGKHINGIMLNPLEYLINPDTGREMTFTTKTEAREYLLKQGLDEEDLYWLVFEEFTP